MAVKWMRAAVILAVLAVAAFIVGFYTRSETNAYVFEGRIAGVAVKSRIPVEEVSTWKDVRLYESQDLGIISCNLMLSAINPAIEYGIYSVNVEYGPMGIEIDERKATVRGETTPDLAESCTAFACLLSGIECPNNLLYARGITGTADAFRIVLDDGASTASVGAYTEMVGALSYLQAKRADVDKNGMVDEIETAANRFYIMPYLNSNGSCRLQPMTSLLQNNNGSNKSIDCSLIRGVHIRESVENTIEVTNDDRIILSGDLDHLLIEAIIVGNVVAPEWISALHGVR